jgi:hypothetical protein
VRLAALNNFSNMDGSPQQQLIIGYRQYTPVLCCTGA